MPAGMAGNGHRAAGGFEIWAARAWNVAELGDRVYALTRLDTMGACSAVS